MSKLGALYVAAMSAMGNDAQSLLTELTPILNRDAQGHRIGQIIGEFFRKQGDSGTLPGGALHNLSTAIDAQSQALANVKERLSLLNEYIDKILMQPGLDDGTKQPLMGLKNHLVSVLNDIGAL